MAKELLIVFVYDCERCQKEEDDPQDAVVYFYPSWVSEQQRLALCGQLIGVSQCLGSLFSSPNILALQTGKFAFKSLGRYILCVGTDRNIPDLVLETRINTLFWLLTFYHKDFESVSEKAGSQFPEKLNQIFETYLPILQFASNVFGSIATFNLPKSGSSVFLEAMQILQSFQSEPGVIGGVLLYQNKVVATQLSARLTKLLVISDPYRIKLPAESVTTQFRLPVGVQLLTVYAESSEVESLLKESSKLNSSLKSIKKWQQDKSKPVKTNKEVISGPNLAMKRDVSRIFTVVEETEGEVEGEKVPDVVRDAVKARKAAKLLSVNLNSFIIPDHTHMGKMASTTDDLPFHDDNKIFVRYLSLGQVDPEVEGKENKKQLKYCNTISDPTFPLFYRNGLPGSQALYHNRVAMHYKKLSQHSEKNMMTMLDLGSKKPTSMSIPLTPLMAKLSLLAIEQSGNELTTPVEKATTLPTPIVPVPKKPKEWHVGPLQENVLYVCGYQDMTLLLLLDPKTSQDPDKIHSLWQTSISGLSEIEAHLHHCLEHGVASGVESYSYLCVVPQWGTIQRGGAWASALLELLTGLHHQFNSRPNLTETIVRSEESIVYGYQCAGMQAFYHQTCSSGGLAGLPAPSDLMGVVSLKAKRRLERDHGIVLL